MMAAGIGCRSGVSLAEVMACFDTALKAHELAPSDITVLATIPARADEPALRDAAKLLQLPITIPSHTELTSAQTLTSSDMSRNVTGLASASEAAALAAAGQGSVLLGPRHVVGNVTCAIATSKETP